MEISVWLPSAAAVIVGVFSVLLSNLFIDNREKRKRRRERVEAMTNYAHALLEWHLFHFSRLSAGAGNHPTPSGGRLEECARKFYPYLREFKGHEEYGNLMSPYYEFLPGAAPWDASNFYQRACDAVEQHIEKHPRAPKNSPYDGGK